MLFQDLHFKIELSICIFCNNIGNIRMTVNLGTNPQTRDVSAHYHFTQEMIKGELEIHYIPSLEQLVDIFTKPLGCSLFEKFRNELNIVSSKSVVPRSLILY